ncbi:MAG: diphthamide biosynthesis enzyme Dph2, partial [Candidatus Diapherotrites archaeon]|nr:diphthamide biosynthesis enzyme Dph2 [Candidatus Diapherotrites archaeon]
LKTSAAEIVNSVEKNTKARVLLFVDPCYGGCDIRDEEAKRANCDLLIHVGHRPFLKNHCMKVIYIDVESKFNKSKIAAGIDKILDILNKKKIRSIAVCSTVYEKNVADYIARELKNRGIKAINAGFVLGCNLLKLAKIGKKVDAVIYYGDDNFYAVGIAKLKKPLFVMRSNGSIEKIDTIIEKMERIRFANIAKAKDAERFAILLSSKRGQLNMRKALETKKLIEEHCKEAIIVISDFVKPEYLLGIDVDAYVLVACPRIMDDSKLFKKPLILPKDLKFILQ